MLESQFSHSTASLDEFPSILTLEKTPLSPQYATLNCILNLSFFLLGCVVCITLYFQPIFELPTEIMTLLPYITGLVAILGVLLSWLGYRQDKVKFYTLRELDLHYTSGLFFQKTVSQPITRIQHVELKRGPIERKVGLAKLQVFSAGGEMHTFQIPGLPVEVAQQLRQFVLQHKDMVKHG